LITYREYSPSMPFHWSQTESILRLCHSIGLVQRIFSVYAIPSVSYREYSPSMPFHWSHTENILHTFHSIVCIQRIFSVYAILLASHTNNILHTCHPTGYTYRLRIVTYQPFTVSEHAILVTYKVHILSI
jgi:hypothetical protein